MKYKKTAHRLNKILNLRGMKPQELCNMSGVSKSSISHYINGSNTPSNLSAGKMAAVLGVDPLWLMGFDVNMEKENSTYIENDKRLTSILYYYNMLNDVGREKIIDRMEELVRLGYVKEQSQQPDAHEIHKDAIQYVRDIDAARNKKDNIG
jgi:transcriptional regulator with XRE-family HTH domain